MKSIADTLIHAARPRSWGGPAVRAAFGQVTSRPGRRRWSQACCWPAHDGIATLNGTQFDRGFLTMMGTHHSGAVELAEAELRADASTEVKAFARQLIAAQQRELRQMKRWNDCETAGGSVMIRAVTGSGGCDPWND